MAHTEALQSVQTYSRAGLVASPETKGVGDEIRPQKTFAEKAIGSTNLTQESCEAQLGFKGSAWMGLANQP